MTANNEQQALSDQIRDAVQSGSDIGQKIKTITLKALSERQLDKDNIKQVAETVSDGIYKGLIYQGGEAKAIFLQAASALDDAMAVAAEASKLALEEAVSKVDQYSRHDLDNAAKDLQDIEGIFIEALEKVFQGNQLLADIAGDFVGHARRSGTAVGEQAVAAMEALQALPQWGKETLISNTVAATVTLAQIGSGILSGIAESLQPPSSKK